MQFFTFGGNWVDLIFIIVVFYFIFSNRGFINTIIEAIGFLFSLGISYQFYKFFGSFLIANFSLSQGLSHAAGFFIAWFFAELVFYFVTIKFILPYVEGYQEHRFNKAFGFVAAIAQAALIFLFFVSLVFALPVRGQVKKDIIDSRSGPIFVNLSQSLEGSLKNVFGQAVQESLNFLTIKPASDERVDLGFKLEEKEAVFDPQSEAQMLSLLNKERTDRGLPPLEADEELRPVARAYAMEMFVNGFFAHVSAVDNSTPADRAEREGVEYLIIGENLALAPDVYLAHQGLMNSEGHRENILSPEYNRVGIGVIDGGVYGRIFVQNFRN